MRRECRERFPCHWLQRKSLVSDPGMHHGTYVTCVPWCMPGSLNCSGGKNVPGIPGACATRVFVYLARSTWLQISARQQCYQFPMPPLYFGDYMYDTKPIDDWYSLLVPHSIIFRICHSYGKIDMWRKYIYMSWYQHQESSISLCPYPNRGTISIAFVSANSRWYLQECEIHIRILWPWVILILMSLVYMQ